MNDPIDIVIPWVNPNDVAWQKDFLYWKEKETGEKNVCRFRDLDSFKYWWRYIEKNCNWCRYIFLILANESQIPDWLNTNHPKLKIVFHEEFIQQSELPTFNSSVINCYVPFIEGLSENYVLFNDDFFVVRPITGEMFFSNNVPTEFFKDDSSNFGKTYWEQNLLNGYKIVNKYTGLTMKVRPEHGALPFNKSINLFLWKKAESEMKRALGNSRFRSARNVTDWIFCGFHYALKRLKLRREVSAYYNRVIPFNSNREIFCFNDTESLIDFNGFKTSVLQFLQKSAPNKSKYEK